MPTDLNQRQAFEFLKAHFRSQDVFTKEDLRRETGWSRSSVETYWTKHFRPFLAATPPIRGRRASQQQSYRVSDSFRVCGTWEKFRQHVTQVRRISSDYTRATYQNLLIYEFYLPLTNETALRTALDSLFT